MNAFRADRFRKLLVGWLGVFMAYTGVLAQETTTTITGRVTESQTGQPLPFANVYLNELDQFMKHTLKIKMYVRYTDDFVIVSTAEEKLQELLPPIRSFLHDHLRLALHSRKVTIRKFGQGIDFLGYVLLPHHRALRTRTKKRMFRKMEERVGRFQQGAITEESVEQSLQSYLGVLSHADAFRLGQELRNRCWFLMAKG